MFACINVSSELGAGTGGVSHTPVAHTPAPRSTQTPLPKNATNPPATLHSPTKQSTQLSLSLPAPFRPSVFEITRGLEGNLIGRRTAVYPRSWLLLLLSASSLTVVVLRHRSSLRSPSRKKYFALACPWKQSNHWNKPTHLVFP